MNKINQEFQEITDRLAEYIDFADDQFFQPQEERELLRQTAQILMLRIHEILSEVTNEELLNTTLTIMNEVTIGRVKFMGTAPSGTKWKSN